MIFIKFSLPMKRVHNIILMLSAYIRGRKCNRLFWSKDANKTRFDRTKAYLLEDEQRDDKSINTQNTSHDNWDNGLEDQFWFEDTHWCNTDSWLGSSIGSSQVYIVLGFSHLLANTRALAIPMKPKKAAWPASSASPTAEACWIIVENTMLNLS